VTLRCGAVLAARGLDVAFEVGTGETVALLGPNGAGKSTVLSVVAGLLRPDRGRVELDGRVLTDVGAARVRLVPPHDRRTTLLTQDPRLFPHLSALDNVAFGPRSTGASRRAARAAARSWLDAVGVAELADRRPAALSGGQAQRVAVARALAAEPVLLLLDEPTAALDVAVAATVRTTLRAVLKGRSALVVTHDLLDALLLADRVLVLEDGRVAEEGPTREVLTRPRSGFAARLAGLNMLTGTWHDGAVIGDHGRVEGLAQEPPPSDGRPAVAVFRPQAVSVFHQRPVGSPRNAFRVRLSDLEVRGDQVRLHAGQLTAEITAHAAADLDVRVGSEVDFVVKATEVAVYPT
jgi:molybdate transport system ATP-binding protein